jgi:hypothetical protein
VKSGKIPLQVFDLYLFLMSGDQHHKSKRFVALVCVARQRSLGGANQTRSSNLLAKEALIK